jgi:hypothetical protein
LRTIGKFPIQERGTTQNLKCKPSVGDEVDLQIGWHFLLELVKELNEFLPMVTWQTASDDFPVQDVASRKKCGRPTPLVVVGLPRLGSATGR